VHQTQTHLASQSLVMERQVSAQTALGERVSRYKTRAILGLMRLNFLSVMAHIVIEIMQDCVPRAMDKHLDIGYEGPQNVPPECLMEGNGTLLRELVRNLVDNAINYTPNTGVVTIRLLVDPFSGVQILQVEDSGPGIPAQERALVLQPFYRALGTNVDGSGLGLAIVHEIAQQHGATVEMGDAHPNRKPPGLLVSVRFPPRENENSTAHHP
jgi:two-component system, OmpR family, sensor histidine kinase TctE